MAKPFTFISGEGWSETAYVRDEDTGGPLTDIDTALIELQVQDRSGNVCLSASTTDGKITRPESGYFTWTFTQAQASTLCSGQQYKVAARMTLGGVVSMIFLNELVVQEAGFTWR